ncbi:hypothetical protein V1264_024167 [Littorina saxatilis]|uniref:Uncharacterized protein n=1 Tax=Littorina saxatilis TaxID=31220 RepID=A0AAN9ALJ3_9CAEN
MQRRKVRDRNDIIRWSDICNCIDSDVASDYMSKFKSATNDLDKKELAGKIEQHLLLQIALQNGKRTGIYADMSVAEFEAAEKRSDGFVVLIAEGKTFKMSGASGIFFSNSE